ncbi:citrate lyase holo-[acyl-carrier protein] synthase [Pyramidobacter sp.]
MDVERILGENGVSLAQMLAARERRAARQRDMLRGGGKSLISYTLNMPGEIKQFPLAQSFFRHGLARLERHLARNGISIVTKACRVEPTGSEAMLLTDGAPADVKRLTVALEVSSPASRLYDMDVLASDGVKISREALGLPPRRCVICGRAAMDCAPRRIHPARELACAAVKLMYDDAVGRFADTVASAAQRALLYEVCVSPKPGLVDRFNSGSHRDMDLFTFMDSAGALAPYFHLCAALGAEAAEQEPERLFQSLRLPGMEAETFMLEATGGVNVHKGAIFSVGVICAARGWLWGRGENAAAERLAGVARKMLTGLKDEFSPQGQSAGEKIFRESGVTGIRGEAAAGFPAVIECGLPVFERLLAENLPLNDAAAVTLLHLIGAADDTNMIRRSSLFRFREVQREIGRLLDEKTVPDMAGIARLDRQFIAENLSPGGSADLLALTLLLHFMRDFESEKAPWRSES